MLTNWKTTLTAVLGAASYVVAAYGVHLTPEVQNSIVVVTVFVVGIFAKDAKRNNAE